MRSDIKDVWDVNIIALDERKRKIVLSVKLVMINSYNLPNIYSLLSKLESCGKKIFSVFLVD